jgi:hypothetical protein
MVSIQAWLPLTLAKEGLLLTPVNMAPLRLSDCRSWVVLLHMCNGKFLLYQSLSLSLDCNVLTQGKHFHFLPPKETSLAQGSIRSPVPKCTAVSTKNTRPRSQSLNFIETAIKANLCF